jgi:hypothetical protein
MKNIESILPISMQKKSMTFYSAKSELGVTDIFGEK